MPAKSRRARRTTQKAPQGPAPITAITRSVCLGLRALVTDIDDTFTLHDRIPAAAYHALEAAQEAGLKTFFTTGRPAGYAELLAKWFPVDAVIAENGGCFFYKHKNALNHDFLQPETERKMHQEALKKIEKEVLASFPGAAVAKDQWLRQCDLAIDYAEEVSPLGKEDVNKILAIFAKHGAHAKVSSIHVNGWFGSFDKYSSFKYFLHKHLGLEVERQKKAFIYLGDSPNDEPLFAAFTHSIGVANIKKFLPGLEAKPTWITRRPGAEGFTEAVKIILAKRY